MKAKIVLNNFSKINELSYSNLVESVSRKDIITYNNTGTYNLLIIDFGIKNNIIRKLLRYSDIKLIICPFYFNYKGYDGIFISNGPGDPKDCWFTINKLKNILDNKINIPLFGIFLGNQLLGLACGVDTVKLKYGNRGINQAVIDLKTKKCYITSQNHGYAIDSNTHGYYIRRKCIDYSIPLFTNVKCTKLFVSSIKNYDKSNITYNRGMNIYLIE